jgi:delta-aminolevulinic acid dehydratase/porphobilinogen synthase
VTDEFIYSADHAIYRSGSPRVASSGIRYGHGLCTILWIKVEDSEWGAVTARDAEPGNSCHQRRIDRDAGPSPGKTVTRRYPTKKMRQEGVAMSRETYMANSENVSILSASDLAMVLLVRADDSRRTMPTVRLKEIGAAVGELADLGIHAVKVFASGDARDCTGSRGKACDSLMARAIREIKAAHPSMIVITETCLCSYTDSGECHLIGWTGRPDLQATIEVIAEQAVAQAAAGADVVGPAAMISGSVSRVRQALDETNHPDVQIMPHLIFDSRLYDAYRQTMDATPASGERRVFQIDPARLETAERASLDSWMKARICCFWNLRCSAWTCCSP